MPKSRPFSIYLLKQPFNAENALKPDHNLQASDAQGVPEGAKLYILDAQPHPPWWKDYFGIQEQLLQEQKGALLFLPIGERCFVLSFGHVFHHLDDRAYEYDFGLRVSLNCLDPKLLKSADMVSPGDARRKGTQVPVSTDLTYLDFDSNSEIIKSLTGAVKPEHQELFKNATGAASFKVSLKLTPHGLADVCGKLLELYESEDYKTSFPNIQNIAPIRDPAEVELLDTALLEAFKAKDNALILSIPDIIDYRDNTCCVFMTAAGPSDVNPDVSLDALFESLGDEFDLAAATLDDLRSIRMLLTDAEGNVAQSYQLYRSLIFDVGLDGDGVICHLCEGKWYKAQKSFVDRLHAYLDNQCEDTDLCPYDHDELKKGHAVYSEGRYNDAVPVWNGTYVCLDKTDVSPAGSTAIEPCDLYRVIDDPGAAGGVRAVMYGIKISTRSSQLSHLFNQGLNSVELLRLEATSRDKIKALLIERIGGNDPGRYVAPIDTSEFKVVFGIITRRDKNEQSKNLPLFSKISLMRTMQRLDLMRIPSALTFIQDNSPAKEGYSQHPTIEVEVIDIGDGKREIRAVPGQGVDPERSISRCSKTVSEAAVGTHFRVRVKAAENGELSSYHKWPFTQID
jgi:uncharacterized protein (TIGR04141 family)